MWKGRRRRKREEGSRREERGLRRNLERREERREERRRKFSFFHFGEGDWETRKNTPNVEECEKMRNLFFGFLLSLSLALLLFTFFPFPSFHFICSFFLPLNSIPLLSSFLPFCFSFVHSLRNLSSSFFLLPKSKQLQEIIIKLINSMVQKICSSNVL